MTEKLHEMTPVETADEETKGMSTRMYKLHVTFIEDVLGTQPVKDVATRFITSKAIDPATGEMPEDEVGTLTEEMERGTTGFHRREDGTRIMYNYHIRGFLKEAGRAFNAQLGVKMLRSKIDNYVFVRPRNFDLIPPKGWTPPPADPERHTDGRTDYCERPLRAETPQGPRTALARSESLPAGTSFSCYLKVYGSAITEKLLRELLDYGQDKGFLQWRNAGYGSFTYTLERVDAEDIAEPLYPTL